MASGEDFRCEYQAYVARKIFFIILLLIVIAVLAVYSSTISGREMTFWEGMDAIIGQLLGKEHPVNSPSWWDAYVVWNVTMPRVMAAVVAGAGLAACGVVMQTVLNNPLAEPFTIGVSSGAVFGASLAIVLGLTLTSGPDRYGIIINAFIFGLIPTVVIISLTRLLIAVTPATMVLAGVAMSFFFSGLTTMLLVGAAEETLVEAYVWQVGSLAAIDWDGVTVMAVVVLPLLLIILLFSRDLNAMSCGDTTALSLGVEPSKVRSGGLVLATLITAVTISYTGIIGFVGLLSPHIVRRFIGGDIRYLLPASLPLGAAMLLFADTITRAIADVDVPVGAVMMFLGSPLFIYLMVRRRT